MIVAVPENPESASSPHEYLMYYDNGLEAIRDAVGPDALVMLDVGLVWDAKTTLQRAALFRPYDLFWLEEPLHPDDLAGYAKVSAGTDQRIAAGEEECTLAGFVRLMDQGGVDIVQVDLTRCGLTRAIAIAHEARRRGVRVVNHNFTTDINTAASLHFLCSLPDAFIMEYCVEPGEISRRLAAQPIPVTDGRARLPDAPGLGVEPDPAVIEAYLVRD